MKQSELTEYESHGIAYKDAETLEQLYWGEGMSHTDIAELADCSPSTISRWMDRHGIETRSNSEAVKKHYQDGHVPLVIDSNEYYRWQHRYDNKQSIVKVHRLVAVAEFGYDAVVDNDIHHRNNIPWDNRPENLEIMGPREHINHHLQGENNHQTGLRKSDVLEIYELANGSGLTQQEIADEFGICRSAVGRIKRGDNWSHLTEQ